MRRAYAYLRVSGKAQVQGDGFPRQLAAIKGYAAEHGIRIVKVFREEGVSGTRDLADRPALSDLMIALHGDGVRLILVEKLDRLARDLMVQETILGDLRKHGFELVSVAEPDLCSNDPTRKLLRQVMGGVAEYEKTMIVLKLRAARERSKAKTGRCEGRKPYGYYEGEPDVIDRMKALRAEKLPYDGIADQLNAEGCRTRTAGKQWFGAAVSRILNAQAEQTKRA
jgi:DNA invertase Pin-like site-specific DNA recombinase